MRLVIFDLDGTLIDSEALIVQTVGEAFRAVHEPIPDEEAIRAIQLLAQIEGVIPALESAHAIAAVRRLAPRLPKDRSIIVNLSGRGDKDMITVGDYLGVKL